tara:strand:+ start:48 stop:1595 length:1548 start_codon:yes stop_codon:yes gene_type:complete
MDVINKFLETYNYKFKAGVFNPNDKDDLLLLERILGSLNLEEGNLKRNGLFDPYGNRNQYPDKGNYATRGHRFIDKVDKGLPFELTNGRTIIIDKQKSIDDGKFNFDLSKPNDVFKGNLYDTDGKRYSLGSLEKTIDLGGEENTTAITESAQAIAVALRFLNDTPLTDNDITLEEFKKVLNDKNIFQQKQTAPDIERVIDYLKTGSDKGWRQSIVNIGNSIADSPLINKELNYKAHWQDEFVDSIYDLFTKIKEKDKNNPLLSLMQDDKWNPADMWLSTEKGRIAIEKGVKEIDNIEQLNDLIDDLFCKGEVIGISLKKTTKLPTIKPFNTDQCSVPKTIKYNKYYMPPKANSKGAHVQVQVGDKKMVLNLRNFGGIGFSGELGGGEAAAGKVGIGPMNAILDAHDLSTYKLPVSPSETLANLSGDYDEKNKVQEKFKFLYDVYVKPQTGESFIEKFDSMIGNEGGKAKVALFYALHVIDALENNTNDPTLMSDIVRYAMSATPGISSAFAKASQ